LEGKGAVAVNTGVYCIRNLIDGKVYVGSTAVSFRGRWRNHLNDLKNNRHICKHLQRAWNKYGGDKFVFEVLEGCDPRLCIVKEQHWMDYCKSIVVLYNQSPTAGSNFGHKFTGEARENNRKAHQTEEFRKKCSSWQMGRNLPAFHRESISRATKGKALSELHKKKIGDAQRGKRKSAKHIASMSASRRGRSLSIRHRAAMRLAQLGRKHSEETKKKISNGQHRPDVAAKKKSWGIKFWNLVKSGKIKSPRRVRSQATINKWRKAFLLNRKKSVL
jgi:group I intron endonuclease